MDLSGRWEFSFDRTLNGQLAPTTVPYELIVIMLDETRFVARFVFPADDPSRFAGELHTTSRNALFTLKQTDPGADHLALYVGRVESPTSLVGVLVDLAGPPGDVRLRKIP